MAKRANIELNFDKTLFSRVLKAKRLEFGRSVSEFAKLLQCSPEQLEDAENGKSPLPDNAMDHFLNLHAFYNLSKLCLVASNQGIGFISVKYSVGPRILKQLKGLFSEEELVVLN